jgi:hypothetical protein
MTGFMPDPSTAAAGTSMYKIAQILNAIDQGNLRAWRSKFQLTRWPVKQNDRVTIVIRVRRQSESDHFPTAFALGGAAGTG